MPDDVRVALQYFAQLVEHDYLSLSLSRISEPDIEEGMRHLALATPSG